MSPFTKKLLLPSIIVGMAFVSITGVIIYESQQMQRFEAEGIKVPGVVTWKGVARSPTTSGRRSHHMNKKNVINFDYTDTQGIARKSADYSLTKTEWDAMTVGQNITVEYLPDSPDKGRLEDSGNERTKRSLKGFAVIGYGIIIIGWSIPFWYWRRKLNRNAA